MSDQILDVLKLVFLALLYLFFARVLWAVWSEVKPAGLRPGQLVPAPEASSAVPVAVTSRDKRNAKPRKGRGTKPARLVVLEPKERRGVTFALTESVTIGRDDDNTINITDDSFISAHHARVVTIDDDVMVEDLGSTNGTVLNGTKLTVQRTLHVGDRVQVGFTILEAQ